MAINLRKKIGDFIGNHKITLSVISSTLGVACVGLGSLFLFISEGFDPLLFGLGGTLVASGAVYGWMAGGGFRSARNDRISAEYRRRREYLVNQREKILEKAKTKSKQKEINKKFEAAMEDIDLLYNTRTGRKGLLKAAKEYKHDAKRAKKEEAQSAKVSKREQRKNNELRAREILERVR